jgi:hypothetical protein
VAFPRTLARWKTTVLVSLSLGSFLCLAHASTCRGHTDAGQTQLQFQRQRCVGRFYSKNSSKVDHQIWLDWQQCGGGGGRQTLKVGGKSAGIALRAGVITNTERLHRRLGGY